MEYKIKRLVLIIVAALFVLILSIVFLPFALLIFFFLPALSWFSRPKVEKSKPKGTIEVLPAEKNEDSELEHTLDTLRNRKIGKKDKFRDL